MVDLVEPDLETSKKLEQATLNPTLSVLDSWTGNAWDVSVSLAWSDMGTNTHERLNFHFRDQTCITQTRFKGAFREAEVTGSLSDGITNFTPEQSLGATLISSNSGEMVIHCD